jgi:S-adenosylmethionine:tRNA ribosyltransferase-isomerase
LSLVAGMLLRDLDYSLPPDLIAQEPAEPRDAARLLVHRRIAAAGCRPNDDGIGGSEDWRFHDLPDLLRPGDLLVRNDTRVLAARTRFRRPSGGLVELLFLHPSDWDAMAQESGRPSGGLAPDDDSEAAGQTAAGEEMWEVLIRGRPRVGEVLANTTDDRWRVDVRCAYGDGRWLVTCAGPRSVDAWLASCGEAPLPPYIRRRLADPERYQTTYARQPGSAAAPTAGLHFTPQLDRRLAAAGVSIVDLTLHVGLGTFRALTEDVVEENRLHAEVFEVRANVWNAIVSARSEGRRVIAVGTTTVRTLEHLAVLRGLQPAEEGLWLRGSSDLFITPGFSFRLVDALLTNFHLPRTSLLALVMAFVGEAETRAIYQHAIRKGYRFYSLGDAMLAI